MIKTQHYWIEITESPLQLHRYLPFIEDPAFGAFVLFGGTVRNFAEGRKVKALHYESYLSLAEQELEQIVQECFQQWDVGRIVVVHRIGTLELSEPSVFILVASAHRAAAFAGCRYIIEQLKKRVPIWKQEIFDDNSRQWKDGMPLKE